MSLKAPRLTVDEDALASQVLEIIGGVTREVLQSLEEPEERDVWSMEEGDDSVFYSDEDQAHQHIKPNTSCDFGASECQNPVNSVTADEPFLQREDDQGKEFITDKESAEMGEEVTQLVILTGQTEEEKPQAPKTRQMDRSESADPETKSDITPEKSENTCGEPLRLNCTSADMQTQPERNTATEKGKRSLALLCLRGRF